MNSDLWPPSQISFQSFTFWIIVSWCQIGFPLRLFHQRVRRRNLHRYRWLRLSTFAGIILWHLRDRWDKYSIIPCWACRSWSCLEPSMFLLGWLRSSTHLRLFLRILCSIMGRCWWWDSSRVLDKISLSIVNQCPIFVGQFILKLQRSNFSWWRSWERVCHFQEHMVSRCYCFHYFEIKTLILWQIWQRRSNAILDFSLKRRSECLFGWQQNSKSSLKFQIECFCLWSFRLFRRIRLFLRRFPP